MKLYKFRSLKSFEYTADIILNKQLYAAHFENLNDPMEGFFSYHSHLESLAKEIRNEKSKLKICSLSKSFDNPILWAHYANDFKGICIEIEVEEDNPNYSIEEMNYNMGTHTIGNGLFDENIPPFDWAKGLLTRKYKEWTYEQEVRILSFERIIKNGISIKAIYLGARISEINKKVIKKIASEISIYETNINEHNKITPLIGNKEMELLKNFGT